MCYEASRILNQARIANHYSYQEEFPDTSLNPYRYQHKKRKKDLEPSIPKL